MTRYVLAGSAGLIALLGASGAFAQAPSWRYDTPSQSPVRRIGDTYTSALNALYSQGFHDVHRMSLRTGEVHAVAVNSRDQRTPVSVDPGSGQISPG